MFSAPAETDADGNGENGSAGGPGGTGGPGGPGGDGEGGAIDIQGGSVALNSVNYGS